MTPKSAAQVERESGGAFHDEPSTPAAEHLGGPITVTDSETGEVFIACPDEHGNTFIDFGDGTIGVHIGDGVFRLCANDEEGS